MKKIHLAREKHLWVWTYKLINQHHKKSCITTYSIQFFYNIKSLPFILSGSQFSSLSVSDVLNTNTMFVGCPPSGSGSSEVGSLPLCPGIYAFVAEQQSWLHKRICKSPPWSEFPHHHFPDVDVSWWICLLVPSKKRLVWAGGSLLKTSLRTSWCLEVVSFWNRRFPWRSPGCWEWPWPCNREPDREPVLQSKSH